MSVPPKRAESIFGQAIEIESVQGRAAFLDQACGNDPTLRAEVEKLVVDHFCAGSFLEQPAMPPGDTTATPAIAEEVGTRIGPYKLLQVLGEGGMGVVYMAEQKEPVKRRVALKIIKPGMDSKQVIARFEAERQALAMMDHPNIASVLDAGTTATGHPYFVMELVKGIPIVTYCNEQHLTPRERLQLLASVCRAVQHAHQKGVIHRDLKPSNVLVAHYDNKPVVKIIDFGLAKATGHQLTEKTLVTFVGQIAGTLEYMSPEQARFNQLDVDTRTDIYSLGVILYELLTGVTPFDRERLRAAALDEIIRILRNEEPPKPSTRVSTSMGKPSPAAANCRTETGKLLALLRGDLDWLVMKALDKERDRRYETAASFAADIERYLRGEPIEARPPSALYRLRKNAARHRVALATVGIVLMTLLAGITLATWQWKVAEEEKVKAKESERLADRERIRAVAAEKETRATLERLKDEAYERALNEALLGGINSDDLIQRAESLDVSQPKLHVLRGLQAFYRGDLQDAIRLLERGEKSVAARAVLAWAYSVAGDHAHFATIAIKLREPAPVSAPDYFLLGQLNAIVRPEIALSYLERGLELDDESVLGHLGKAMALATAGLNQSREQYIEQAIEEVAACRTFKRNNGFVMSTYLYVHCVARQFALQQGDDGAALLHRKKAEEASEELKQMGSQYVLYRRAFFLSLSGHVDEAMVEWETCLQPGARGFAPMIFAPITCLFDREVEGINRLREADDVFSKLALACMHAHAGNHTVDVLQTYHDIVDQDTSCDTRVFALQLLLMLGRPNETQEEAVELLKSSTELILPYKAHLEFLAGGSADELLEASPNLGHFTIALKAFAEGDRETARHHFEASTKRHFVSAQFWWSKVYLAELEKDTETKKPAPAD